MNKTGRTPDGTQLIQMIMPPKGTRRNIMNAAAQTLFDNLGEPSMDLNKAIVAQQETRTPSPMTSQPVNNSPREMNRLTTLQRAALVAWLSKEQVQRWMIGKTLFNVASEFNSEVAQYSEAFGETRVTDWNVRSIIVDLGYGTLSHCIVLAKKAALDVLTDPAKEAKPKDEAPALPAGITAVQMYRGKDGRLYETAEAAALAGDVDELGQFIYENQDGHDEQSAKDLAKSLLSAYNITLK